MSTETQSRAQATSPAAWTDASLAPVYADALEAAGYDYCRVTGWHRQGRPVAKEEALELLRQYVIHGAATSTDDHIRRAWAHAAQYARLSSGLKFASGVLLVRALARRAATR